MSQGYVQDTDTCELCGRSTRSKYGVCQRTLECREEYDRRYHGTKMRKRAKVSCAVCGRRTWSALGVCRSDPGCREEYDRRYNEAAGRCPRKPRRPASVPPLDVLEEWRPIVGYEGLYEVSDQGRVKNIRGREAFLMALSLHDGKDPVQAYLDVRLCDASGRRRTRKVHHLVAEAFYSGRVRKGSSVRHGLGGPSDNRLVNLSYGTFIQNAADREQHRQLMRAGTGEGLSESDALAIYRACVEGELPASVEKEYVSVMRHASAGAEATEIGQVRDGPCCLLGGWGGCGTAGVRVCRGVDHPEDDQDEDEGSAT